MSPPEGFPTKLSGPLVWEPASFKSNSYVVKLGHDDIEDIDNALAKFNRGNASIPHLLPDNFPLSKSLGDRLRGISESLHNGRGFAVLRGLNTARYNDKENVAIFVGLSGYVGDKRGFKLNHLYDRTKSSKDLSRLLPPHLPISMAFHTDVGGGDNLALYVQSTSSQGGGILLSSFWQIYNRMLQEYPRYLKLLTESWPWEDPEGGKNAESVITNRPIIYCCDNKVQIRFARTFLKGSSFRPRSRGAPELTLEQSDALEILSCLAKEYSIRITPEPGDILFVNNLAILHAREAFVDAATKRHLIRMSIRDSAKCWKIPEAYRTVFEKKFSVEPKKQQLWTAKEFETRVDGDMMPDHD